MRVLMRRVQRGVRVVATCILLGGARQSVAQAARSGGGVIDGLVTDTALAPISGASVTILGATVHLETGGSGRFRIHQVPPGHHLLIVQRLGFGPVSAFIDVSPDDTVRLAYTLERVAAGLDTAYITEERLSPRMGEFETRRQAGGGGQFITREEIERHGSVFATELLRTLHGVMVSAEPHSSGTQYHLVSNRFIGGLLPGGTGICYAQIFVDGVRQPELTNLDALTPPKDIAGIELYSGAATVPPLFAGNGTRCGVLLIWTKDGG